MPHPIKVQRVAFGVACLLVACGGNGGDPEPLSTPIADAGGEETLVVDLDGGLTDVTPVDPPIDCKIAAADGSICSCTEVGQDPPTLYLVLDRSGSMAEKSPDTTKTRWRMIREALAGEGGILRKLGTRIKIAVTWFPSPSIDDVCNAGREVVHPTLGGQKTYDDLDAKLASAIPRGATPTAATLDSVHKAIAAIKGPVHVLLATDGAPNCGDKVCTAETCTYNLEHAKLLGESACDSEVNCCDPKNVSLGLGWRACSDDDATAKAAAKIASEGRKVFVLGIPGTIDAYRTHLDAIAEAGGAENDGPTKYWAPTDDASLASALSNISARAIDSCEVRLEKPIADPGVTNLLLDGAPITADQWTWKSPELIELVGAACDKVHAGGVTRISVAVGCKTVTR